mmetsp:Transcript_8016/g.23812  ORF Transcript_8016/g.23812 Transcript_8016/m.23812 type:complete len:229 (+) Transcript_8016:728-1414(+)
MTLQNVIVNRHEARVFESRHNLEQACDDDGPEIFGRGLRPGGRHVPLVVCFDSLHMGLERRQRLGEHILRAHLLPPLVKRLGQIVLEMTEVCRPQGGVGCNDNRPRPQEKPRHGQLLRGHRLRSAHHFRLEVVQEREARNLRAVRSDRAAKDRPCLPRGPRYEGLLHRLDRDVHQVAHGNILCDRGARLKALVAVAKGRNDWVHLSEYRHRHRCPMKKRGRQLAHRLG